MATNSQLPLSRVISTQITRNTLFRTERGFGTLLIVTPQEITGVLDADNRTKRYSGIDEVAADFQSTDEAYLAAVSAFSQEPRPIFIKIGYRDETQPVADQLDLIAAEDPDWYGLTFTKEMRDDYAIGGIPQVPLVAAWVSTQTRLCFFTTNDPLLKDANDITNIAYQLKQFGYDRVGVYYHDNVDVYPDAAFFGRGLRTDFDVDDSTITMKFKRLVGIPTVNVSTAEVVAITGFVEGQGLVDNAGHFANTYVNVSGQNINVEGNMISGEFFDVMHFVDWLQERVNTRVFALYTRMPKVPMTDAGVQMVVNEVQAALEEGIANGGIAGSDVDALNNPIPPYTIDVANVTTLTPNQRANRIAPTIAANARLAGAQHYAVVEINLEV